jgi:nucleoside-diphosphate-sugar epimerase
MKIGIIGGTGMLGHHIAIAAQLRSHEIVIIHRASSDLSKIADLKYESRIADLNDRGALIRAAEGLDVLINAAAYYPTLPKPLAQEIKTARNQMQHFLDAVKEAKIKKGMYVGGAIAIPKNKTGLGHEALFYDEIPHGTPAYTQVKWLMDKMAREAANEGLPISIGIPSMTFGEYDYGPTTGRLIVDLANKTLPAYLKGQRNIVYAGDAGRGLLAVAEKGRPGERYLITGYNTSTTDVVNLICKIADVPKLTKTLPLKLAKLISKFQEIKYTLVRGDEPTLSSTAIAVLTSGQHLDGKKAKDELNYSPEIDIKSAIEKAYKWFKLVNYIK